MPKAHKEIEMKQGKDVKTLKKRLSKRRSRVALIYICNPLSEALVHYKRKSTVLKMIRGIRVCFEGQDAWGQTCKIKN